MATIERYVLVDADDHEGEHEYESFEAAKLTAERETNAGRPTAVIERHYVYDDSELVWTPFPYGRTWPPKKLQKKARSR